MPEEMNGRKVLMIGEAPRFKAQKIHAFVGVITATCECGTRVPVSSQIIVTDQGLNVLDFTCAACGTVWALRNVDYELEPRDNDGNLQPPRIHFGLKMIKPAIVKPPKPHVVT